MKTQAYFCSNSTKSGRNIKAACELQERPAVCKTGAPMTNIMKSSTCCRSGLQDLPPRWMFLHSENKTWKINPKHFWQKSANLPWSVSHSLFTLQHWCPKMFRMRQGKVVQSLCTDESYYVHIYTTLYQVKLHRQMCNEPFLDYSSCKL